MNSKERVITALKNKEPDRIPVYANLTPQVAKKLGEKMNLTFQPVDSFLSQRISYNEILLKLGNDAVGIGAGRADNHSTKTLENGRLKDEWGIIYEKIGLYEEAVYRPLGEVENIDDLNKYNFPSAEAPGRFTLAEKMVEEYGKKYAIIGNMETTMFEKAWNLVGLEKYLMDLSVKKHYTIELLDRLKEYSINCGKKLIELGADIIWTGDDFGTQQGMMISSDLWREIFKPRFKEVFAEFKKINPEIIIAYHSCGSIRPIIEDMIEIGLEVLNPIQPLAKNMNLKELKLLYGDELTFFGGVDIQKVLPEGTTEDVRKEVKKRTRAAGKGGGYLLAPAHNIQPDTPLENIYTFFQSVREYGQYPLIF